MLYKGPNCNWRAHHSQLPKGVHINVAAPFVAAMDAFAEDKAGNKIIIIVTI